MATSRLSRVNAMMRVQAHRIDTRATRRPSLEQTREWAKEVKLSGSERQSAERGTDQRVLQREPYVEQPGVLAIAVRLLMGSSCYDDLDRRGWRPFPIAGGECVIETGACLRARGKSQSPWLAVVRCRRAQFGKLYNQF